MDDKTLIASYVAEEAERINKKLKKMVESSIQPSDAERDEIIGDIEQTLSRLQNALSNITPDMLEDEEKNDRLPQ